jgi:peptide deformylase
MHEDLKIVLWPDPRLRKVSAEVTTFNDDLKTLTARMFDLMRAARGVGLAAPQVGENIRLFVMNHTGKPEDDRIFVNPVLTDAEGDDDGEEGCLSLPNIHVDVIRSKKVHMAAQDVAGVRFQEDATGYVARIWQHEFDHLNGVLLTDRMGPVAKMANRKILKDLEEAYAAANPKPKKKL